MIRSCAGTRRARGAGARAGWLPVVVVTLAACGGGSAAPGSPDTTSAPTTTTAPATTTTTTQTSTTTTTTGAGQDWVVQPAADALPSPWRREFVIGHGEAEDLLGSAPGGENLMLGPD